MRAVETTSRRLGLGRIFSPVTEVIAREFAEEAVADVYVERFLEAVVLVCAVDNEDRQRFPSLRDVLGLDSQERMRLLVAAARLVLDSPSLLDRWLVGALQSWLADTTGEPARLA